MNYLFKFICASVLFASSIHGGIVFRNGEVWDSEEVATLPVENHYELGAAAYNQEDWEEACKQYSIVTLNFPNHPLSHRAHFFLGVSLFHEGEFEFSNKSFNKYLSNCQGHPEFFEDAICYKLEIAHGFREGEPRHIFGMRKMPRWLSSEKLALEIYDEIILAAPSHEAAVQSLYFKSFLLWNLRDYRASITSLEVLVKRFPTHELAAESFITMNKIYMDWSNSEFQNPDILAMAEINQKKFEEAFPGEERLIEGRSDLLAIKESYARGLYETGRFYERISQPEASVIYYRRAINQFPETTMAQKCFRRLERLSSGES